MPAMKICDSRPVFFFGSTEWPPEQVKICQIFSGKATKTNKKSLYMLSNLQLSRTITKEKVPRMDTNHKTVSQEKMLEEWRLIQEAQKDPAQFRPLYDQYYTPIFRFIFQRTADQNLCADICSQVFLKALQRLDKYQFRGVPFSAWLYRIATNEVAEHYRKARKNRVICVKDIHLNDIAEEVHQPPNEQLLQNLIQCLDQLKTTDLQLIELRFFERRPFKEIANILGITESNAKVKTYRILERMKKRLNKHSASQSNGLRQPES